jgi:hypothetical protein
VQVQLTSEAQEVKFNLESTKSTSQQSQRSNKVAGRGLLPFSLITCPFCLVLSFRNPLLPLKVAGIETSIKYWMPVLDAGFWMLIAGC